jgi:hypothetical protein
LDVPDPAHGVRGNVETAHTAASSMSSSERCLYNDVSVGSVISASDANEKIVKTMDDIQDFFSKIYK